MKLSDLMNPFEIYRNNKRKCCITAIVIIMIINMVSYIVFYYAEPKDPDAEMENKIYKGASKEVEILEDTCRQQDPSFPDVKIHEENIDYEKEDKSVFIGMNFDESLSASTIEEFTRAIAKGAFEATSENELAEVEVFTEIGGWPRPFIYARDEFS